MTDAITIQLNHSELYELIEQDLYEHDKCIRGILIGATLTALFCSLSLFVLKGFPSTCFILNCCFVISLLAVFLVAKWKDQKRSALILVGMRHLNV